MFVIIAASAPIQALLPTSAGAATGYGPYYVVGTGSNGLNERAAASTSSSLVGNLRNDATLYIACQASGAPYATGGSPASDSIWDQLSSGVYVADYWVSTPAVGTFSSGIPRCGATPPPPAPTSELRNRANVRCLDADAGSIGTNGTKVQLWNCWGGANQNWRFNSNGTIQNQVSGRCLDADMNTIGVNGTIVHLWDCNGGANQRWIVNSNGSIQNAYNRRCLDANGPTVSINGTKVQLWNCNGGRNQSWYEKSAYTVAYSSAFSYCVPSVRPYNFGTGINFKPCVFVTYVYDGTSSAARSVQASGCNGNVWGFSETMTCSVTRASSDWNGNASATLDVNWDAVVVTSVPAGDGDVWTVTTTSLEDDGDTLKVSISPSGQPSGSFSQAVKAFSRLVS